MNSFSLRNLAEHRRRARRIGALSVFRSSAVAIVLGALAVFVPAQDAGAPFPQEAAPAAQGISEKPDRPNAPSSVHLALRPKEVVAFTGGADVAAEAGEPNAKGERPNKPFELLRQSVAAKNRLWFDYWRPNGLRLLNAGGRESSVLNALLAETAGLKQQEATMSSRQILAFVAEVRERVNPKQGEQIFRRPELGCVACHAVNGQGGVIGPDLSALGTARPIDFIVGAILD